jgi:CRP-like cAMP-binding protein
MMVDPCFKLDTSAFVADAELLEALEKRATDVICQEDRVLFNQGDTPDGLYILHAGDAVLQMKAADGEIVMCMQTFAGSLLGLPGLIGDEPYSLTATAHRGAELKFVSREDFLTVMSGDPLLSFKVLQVLAAEVRSARQALLAS